MIGEDGDALPDFQEWSTAAVRLLQGVVYHDDEKTWDRMLSNRTTLEGYVGRIGLRLIIDESDGFAYLKQLAAEELPREYEDLPKLFRNAPLSYGATLLCVLLREELRRFEDEDVHNERCVVPASELFDQWKMFFPSVDDEVKQRKEFERQLRTLDELKFVRRVNDDPQEWEIRRILKARVTAADIESLKEQLLTASRRRSKGKAE